MSSSEWRRPGLLPRGHRKPSPNNRTWEEARETENADAEERCFHSRKWNVNWTNLERKVSERNEESRRAGRADTPGTPVRNVGGRRRLRKKTHGKYLKRWEENNN